MPCAKFAPLNMHSICISTLRRPNFVLDSLCALCNITSMARGPSGRIVVETDPQLKRDLHTALAADETTLKDWLEEHARSYLATRIQPSLPGFKPTTNTLEKRGSA